MKRLLPAAATVATLLAAVTSWLYASEALLLYATIPVVGAVAFLMALDRSPLAISMGVLLVLMAGITVLSSMSPILQDGEEVIPAFPPALAALESGIGVLAMVLAVVARHEAVANGMKTLILAIAWFGYSALFFIEPSELATPLGWAALPGLLCLVLVALGVRWTMVAAQSPTDFSSEPLSRPT